MEKLEGRLRKFQSTTMVISNKENILCFLKKDTKRLSSVLKDVCPLTMVAGKDEFFLHEGAIG